MASFIRHTISFTKRQITHLKEKAVILETSMADVLRRIIDEDIEKK